jgi:hypothetical protein
MSKPSKKRLSFNGFMFGLFFELEDGGNTFLGNASELLSDYTALYPRR